ncbi:high mobility group box-domain-containing protein [Cladorrhinum sp. PSN332]|nr:high mobility group box-domain-containing protein [Cladorrhinum sp. PSN332]
MSLTTQINMAAGQINDSTPLSFVFWGNELIVQCIAEDDAHDNIVTFLRPVAKKFSYFINDRDTALIQRRGTRVYYIVSYSLAMSLDTDIFVVLSTTYQNIVALPAATKTIHAIPMVSSQRIAKNGRIPRPRNQFIIYRQWMSTRLQAENPGLTAGSISQVVSQMWHAEKPSVKAHFKALADHEDRVHKVRFPGYRYEAGQPRIDRHIRASATKSVPFTTQEIVASHMVDGF